MSVIAPALKGGGLFEWLQCKPLTGCDELAPGCILGATSASLYSLSVINGGGITTVVTETAPAPVSATLPPPVYALRDSATPISGFTRHPRPSPASPPYRHNGPPTSPPGHCSPSIILYATTLFVLSCARQRKVRI